MVIDVVKLSDQQLKNLIENHRRKRVTDSALYLDALAEQARRNGHGLDFDKSFQVIRHAAGEGHFVSYKELAEASGANWNQVHYSISGHLWSLVEYAHRREWPMLSAIVVNKTNITTGTMEPNTLKGFIAAARELGYSIVDAETFLREQQRLVFEWAAASPLGAQPEFWERRLIGAPMKTRGLPRRKAATIMFDAPGSLRASRSGGAAGAGTLHSLASQAVVREVA